MILEEKTKKLTGRSFEECTTKDKICIQCDYCGEEIQRVKKSVVRSKKNVTKDCCNKSECKNKKRSEVSKILYGSENYFTSEAHKKKSAETNLKKYGCENYFQSDDFRKKRKKSLVERYGVESPLQNDQIRHKVEQTCKEKYGVENYSQHKDFKEKSRQTSLLHYGTDSPTQTKEVIEKRNQTSLKKYGKTSYSKTEEYWERRKATCVERYGVEHPWLNSEIKEKQEKTMRERYGVSHACDSQEFMQKKKDTCLDRYGVTNPLMLAENRPKCKTEEEMRDWINKFGFHFEKNMSVLKDRELDLYDDNLKLAIEYCGLYWHNEKSNQPKYKHYHYSKYARCKRRGVRLITIFEDEWLLKQEQCKSFILATCRIFEKKIFARKCEVLQVEKSIGYKFLNQYHIQGAGHRSIVIFGLHCESELIGIMSLGKHHRNNEDLILDRLCFAPGIQIVGGSSKLFSYASKWALENGYEKISSWSDNRWSAGNVYEKLGFVCDKEWKPDYSYVDLRKGKRLSKQSQKKSNTRCPSDMTEKQWAEERGLARIWDCGKKRWVFNLT